MRDKLFCDSNIFLYAFSMQDKNKKEIASDIILSHCVISTQVINEISNNLLKKFHFDDNQIQDFILSCYNRYDVAEISKEVLLLASKTREIHNISYWDSLIIATALENKCTILYTEDMQHKQVIEDRLTIINPFK
jgi:predicted nucleic acid-binding protein